MILKQSTAQAVKIGPFLDNTTGAPETSLTITQADMQLSKDGGAFAQKSAAGNATHDADGWYDTTLSTTDTNTVGELKMQVVISGALVFWTTWYVVEEAIYDSLFGASAAGFDANQRVNVGQWLSQAVTLSVGNLPDVNMKEVSDDETAADNIEATYDGTGYTDDEAPAKQSQLASLTSVGAAINTPAESYTLTTGTQSANTFAETAALDGTEHQHTDTAGVMELYYQFDVGGDGVPVNVTVTGRINGGNDTLDGVYAYNWAGVSWDRVGDFAGQASSVNVVRNYDLYTSHVGTGANLGKVRIRFYAASGLTTATLSIDQIFTSYAVVNRSVGYEGGAVWIDTNASNTNTESFVDGTADNPVSTLAAATTIAGNLGLKVFHLLPSSSVTLAQSYDNYEFRGYGYTVALAGQSLSGASFENATITGNDDGSNGVGTAYLACVMGSNTLGKHRLQFCQLSGDIVLAEAADYFWDACFSGVAGTATPSVDFESAIETKNLSVRHYSGGLEFKNFGAGGGTHTASMEGFGQVVLNANCAGGALAIRGMLTVTDNAGGAVTLSDDARIDVAQINAEVLDVMNTDTFAEPGSVPAATATIQEMLHWLFTISRNKGTQTNTTKTLRNDADSGDIATSTISDVAGTFTRGEYT